MIRTPFGRYYVMTTRFTPETYSQYRQYTHQHIPRGSVYGSPIPISDNIPENAKMFVIEMLNLKRGDTDFPGKITGISLIRNRTYFRLHNMYDIERYNRYTYMGPFRIDRTQFHTNNNMMIMIRRLEFALFRGSYHQKRPTGITMLPEDYIRDAKGINSMLLQLLHEEIQENMD